MSHIPGSPPRIDPAEISRGIARARRLRALAFRAALTALFRAVRRGGRGLLPRPPQQRQAGAPQRDAHC